jgi:hypothetical protein
LAGRDEPEIRSFDVTYLASDLVAQSFPLNDDRAGLLALIEDRVEGDLLGMGARHSLEGVRISFHFAVFSAAKPC